MHRRAEIEKGGLEFDPGSPRTSEIGREDANMEVQRRQDLGVGNDKDDYDIILDASLTINARNQCNRLFPAQSRSSCDLSGVENWVHDFMQAEDGRYGLAYTQYTISRRILRYFLAGRKNVSKTEMDLGDFSVA